MMSREGKKHADRDIGANSSINNINIHGKKATR
jgi:hypothetical protein